MNPTRLRRSAFAAVLLTAIGCASSATTPSEQASGGSANAGTAGNGLGAGNGGGESSNAGTWSSGGGSAGSSGSAGSVLLAGSGNAGSDSGATSGAAGASAGRAGTDSGGTSGTAGASGGSAGSGAGSGGSAGSNVDSTKKITVWLAGDSTMQLCSNPCPCGWGSQFQPLFTSNATVVDNGAGGRSIQTWLYENNVTNTMSNGECVVNPKTYSARWQAMLDPVKGMKPGDYLFIEFGINDGDSTCNRHVGTALFQSYLGVMAKAAKERGTQPIFLTSTSYVQCTGASVTPNRGFGPATQAAAKENDVPLIDLTALSAALYTRLKLCPNSLDFTSKTSAVGKFFCDDHTHFEAAGAAQIAQVVAQALRDQHFGLAAYLK